MVERKRWTSRAREPYIFAVDPLDYCAQTKLECFVDSIGVFTLLRQGQQSTIRSILHTNAKYAIRNTN